jgi:triosephosphate isomerase (TIM)
MHGETDQIVADKAKAALAHRLTPIVCVGETLAEREAGQTDAVVKRQLSAVIHTLAHCISQIVVAYEPVWAIGSGQAATPEQAEQVAEQLRGVVAKVLGDEVADATRILYGGSVKSSNVASFLRQPNVDGALVGGASLDIAEFASIAQFRKHVGT